jgi:hypothetical protein
MIVGGSIVVLRKPMFNKDFKCEKHSDVCEAWIIAQQLIKF